VQSNRSVGHQRDAEYQLFESCQACGWHDMSGL
jgi:hypothetical protein